MNRNEQKELLPPPVLTGAGAICRSLSAGGRIDGSFFTASINTLQAPFRGLVLLSY
jgi:hypothetical protein